MGNVIPVVIGTPGLTIQGDVALTGKIVETGISVPAVSVSGTGALLFNSSTKAFNISENTGAWAVIGGLGYRTGLEMRNVSITTYTHNTGKAVGSNANTANIVLSSQVTVDTTIAGALGTDQKLTGKTGNTHGTTTIDSISSSIVSDLGTKVGLGTSISTSGTTVTGVGTAWAQPHSPSELTVNDLIGNSTKGWSRVTAIASDTSCTIVAATPGGDILGGSSYTIIENATIWPAAVAADKLQINTLSADGLTVVVTSATSSNANGVTITVGVIPNTLTQPFWMYSWGGTGVSGITVFCSTQRTVPYGITGYNVSTRLLASLPFGTGGLLSAFQRQNCNCTYKTIYEEAVNANGTRVLNGGAGTSWTAVVCNAVVPVFAREAVVGTVCVSTAVNRSYYFRETGTGSATTTRPFGIGISSANVALATTTSLTLDGTASFDYVISGNNSSLTVNMIAFIENLGPF